MDSLVSRIWTINIVYCWTDKPVINNKGLANSRIGIVLVTPSFLKRVKGEGIADKELSALLARDLLIPVVHNTTFDDLREVSPLLGSRSGLSTIEESLEAVAAKISELVTT